MAPIWAFTGRTEIKGEHSWRKRSLTNSDIVNDQSRAATVLVDGEINGTPFELERSVTKRTLKKLRFVYGGEDLTCETSRRHIKVVLSVHTFGFAKPSHAHWI